MATSGSITTSKYSGRYYKLAWERTSYSVTDNTSTIKWTLSCHGGSASWYAERTLKAVINGTTVFSKTARKERYTGTIDTGTMTIKHNTDGTKTFSMSLKAAVYVSDVNCTGSGNATLDTIPRASSVSATSNYVGLASTITINRASSAFTHTLTWSCGSLSGTIATKTTSTSVSWTLPTSLYTVIGSKNTSATVTITCTTYNGSTSLGSKTTTLKANTSASRNSPTATLTVEPTDSATLRLCGSTSKIILGFSDVKYTLTGTAKDSATVASYKVTNGSVSETTTTGIGTFSADDIKSSKFSGTVTDSRGYSTTVYKEFGIDAVDYIKITCNCKANMSADGVLTYTASGNFFNNSFGAVTNDLHIQYRLTVEGEDFGDWIDANGSITLSGNTYSYSQTITGLDYQTLYIIEVRAIDELYTAFSATIKVNAFPVFDWGENDFNFNVPISINGVNIFNLVYPVGAIYMSVNNVNPSTLFGGTWVAWGAGRVPVGVNTSDSNFNTVEKTGGASTHTLTTAQIPAHTHGSKALTGKIPSQVFYGAQTAATNGIVSSTIHSKRQYKADGTSDNAWANITINATHEHNSVGGSSAHNNLQPYITCYMWKRTA